MSGQSGPFDKRKAQFSLNDINYIYNRVFDLAWRDKRSTYALGTVFINLDYKLYDTLLITVDPNLKEAAFVTNHIPVLKSISFDSVLSAQSQFEHIHIYNPDFIQWKHYDSIPSLRANHLMHVEFSDIYYSEEFYYIGIKITQQMFTRPPYFNETRYSIFKFEWCNNLFVLFRTVYYVLGKEMSEDMYGVHELDDRSCH